MGTCDVKWTWGFVKFPFTGFNRETIRFSWITSGNIPKRTSVNVTIIVIPRLWCQRCFCFTVLDIVSGRNLRDACRKRAIRVSRTPHDVKRTSLAALDRSNRTVFRPSDLPRIFYEANVRGRSICFQCVLSKRMTNAMEYNFDDHSV